MATSFEFEGWSIYRLGARLCAERLAGNIFFFDVLMRVFLTDRDWEGAGQRIVRKGKG